MEILRNARERPITLGAFMGPPASPTSLAEVDGRAWIDAEQR